MALPMLRTIQQSGGDLPQRNAPSAFTSRAPIRDEIRGRKLLNDAVREQVMLARRRGTTVTLLDEGGIDDLESDELERVLEPARADALRGHDADKVIARTVPEGSEVAVTVVGLRSTDDGSASALGDDADDDEVELWLEIPRSHAPERVDRQENQGPDRTSDPWSRIESGRQPEYRPDSPPLHWPAYPSRPVNGGAL